MVVMMTTMVTMMMGIVMMSRQPSAVSPVLTSRVPTYQLSPDYVGDDDDGGDDEEDFGDDDIDFDADDDYKDFDDIQTTFLPVSPFRPQLTLHWFRPPGYDE